MNKIGSIQDETSKLAYVGWGGRHKTYGKLPVQGTVGYSNILGLLPFPAIGIRVGNPKGKALTVTTAGLGYSSSPSKSFRHRQKFKGLLDQLIEKSENKKMLAAYRTRIEKLKEGGGKRKSASAAPVNMAAMRDEFEKIAATAALTIIRGLLAAGKTRQARSLAAKLISRNRTANLSPMGPLTQRQARIAALRKKLGIVRPTDPRTTRGLKVTHQGSQARYLGGGAEGPAHLMVGSRAGLKHNPGGIAVRKTYDTSAPMFSKADLVRKHNLQRRLGSQSKHPKNLAKAIEGTGPVKGGVARLLSPKIHRGKGGARYTLSEYVPGTAAGNVAARHEPAVRQAAAGMEIKAGGGLRATGGRREGVRLSDTKNHPDNVIVSRYQSASGVPIKNPKLAKYLNSAPSRAKAVDFSASPVNYPKIKVPKAWGKHRSIKQTTSPTGNIRWTTDNPNIANYLDRRLASAWSPMSRIGPENMARLELQNEARRLATKSLFRAGRFGKKGLNPKTPGLFWGEGGFAGTAANPLGQASKARALSGYSPSRGKALTAIGGPRGQLIGVSKAQRPVYEKAMPKKLITKQPREPSEAGLHVGDTARTGRPRSAATLVEGVGETAVPSARIVSGRGATLTQAGAKASRKAKSLASRSAEDSTALIKRLGSITRLRRNTTAASPPPSMRRG